MVDVEKSFKSMVKKGTVVFGSRQARLAVDDGKAKLVVVSSNSPFLDEMKEISKEKKVPLYHSSANSVDLGSLCGKVFAVSTFAVLDDGGVNIIQMLGKR
ncbi:MAG: 50S ribosomal protein L30e [Candidatus Heimdallarchaeota archaeon]|nr:50S ribosomal protein L30e [Candidatus Heimdallarchaeota archaeon]